MKYRLTQETKQHTLINPCEYYCVTSVLRSFKGYFYSSKIANIRSIPSSSSWLIFSGKRLHLANLKHFGISSPLTSDEWLPLQLLYRYYKMLSSTSSTTINRLFHLSNVTVKYGKRIVNRLCLCISY